MFNITIFVHTEGFWILVRFGLYLYFYNFFLPNQWFMSYGLVLTNLYNPICIYLYYLISFFYYFFRFWCRVSHWTKFYVLFFL